MKIRKDSVSPAIRGGLAQGARLGRPGDYLTGAAHYIYEKGMPRGVPTSPEKEARIVARLLVERHASLVARDEGVSFAKVWRLAERECIELTAGYEARGYWRLSPERRAAVIEARRDNPGGTQQEIARAAGVSRATVSRIERGDRRRGPAGPKVG